MNLSRRAFARVAGAGAAAAVLPSIAMRVTIGKPEQMEAFVRAFTEVIA